MKWCRTVQGLVQKSEAPKWENGLILQTAVHVFITK
jgi:hypothetical protein